MQGSSAEIANILNLPVILLVNARMAGYSVAPLLYGYKNFFSGVHIAGVIFNQVSSPAHYAHLREACSDTGLDCLGYLPVMEEVKLFPKHNAISLANRRIIDEQANIVASQIEKSIDISRMLNRCNRNFPCQYTLPYYSAIFCFFASCNLIISSSIFGLSTIFSVSLFISVSSKSTIIALFLFSIFLLLVFF